MDKTFFTTALALIFLILVSSPVSAEVKIKGTVYWVDWTQFEWKTLDDTYNREYVESMGLEIYKLGDYLEGYNANEQYQPARGLKIMMSFGDLLPKTIHTDGSGRYEITKMNPIVGDYTLRITVYGETLLHKGSAFLIPYENTAKVLNKSTDETLEYYGKTDTRSIGDDETLTWDIFIGGSLNNITSYRESIDTNGENLLISVFLTQSVREAFQWAINASVDPDDVYEDTIIYYPLGKVRPKYKPIYGLGWDVIHWPSRNKDIFPKYTSNASFNEKWLDMQGSVYHEYGHKLMDDVYWFIPRGILQEFDSSHSYQTCRTDEFAFMEGWAEFYAAAVSGYPTFNGKLGQPNIELSWSPENAEPFPGKLNWREEVPCNGNRQINEAENVAVLWDIHDPAGWEYFPEAMQNWIIGERSWPEPVKWYDRLEDPDLSLIWPIMADHDPDCLLDDGDLWKDSFVYYWLEKFEQDKEKIHGLKSVLYNRGITSTSLPEHNPTLSNLRVENGNIVFEAEEQDEEDRPFLYYNIASVTHSDPGARPMFPDNGKQVEGEWDGSHITVTTPLPVGESIKEVWVILHDHMMIDGKYLELETPDYSERDMIRNGRFEGGTLEGWQEGESETGPTWAVQSASVGGRQIHSPDGSFFATPWEAGKHDSGKAELSQTVDLSPVIDNLAEMSVRLEMDVITSEDGIEVRLHFLDQSGNPIENRQIIRRPGSGHEVKHHRVNVKEDMPAGTRYVTLVIQGFRQAGNWIDAGFDNAALFFPLKK